jgi:hypothetical protein
MDGSEDDSECETDSCEESEADADNRNGELNEARDFKAETKSTDAIYNMVSSVYFFNISEL